MRSYWGPGRVVIHGTPSVPQARTALDRSPVLKKKGDISTRHDCSNGPSPSFQTGQPSLSRE